MQIDYTAPGDFDVDDIEVYPLNRQSYKEFVTDEYERRLSDLEEDSRSQMHDLENVEDEEYDDESWMNFYEAEREFWKLNVEKYPYGFSTGEETGTIFIPDTEKEFKILNVPLEKWTEVQWNTFKSLRLL